LDSPKQPRHMKDKSLSRENSTLTQKAELNLDVEDAEDICQDLGPAFVPERDGSDQQRRKPNVDWRTTEEKKAFLGTMLGNVDALVEGVRKAGIWGLG